MFDIGPSELLLCAIVALVVIGPKDLPRVMRTVGQWVARARGMARHFRTGVDTMIREAELEEMQKQWAAENARIMAEHPVTAEHMGEQPVLPDPDAPVTAAPFNEADRTPDAMGVPDQSRPSAPAKADKP